LPVLRPRPSRSTSPSSLLGSADGRRFRHSVGRGPPRHAGEGPKQGHPPGGWHNNEAAPERPRFGLIAVSWWVGDWWKYEGHEYGDRKAALEAGDWQGPAYQTCRNNGWVCEAFETSRRRDILTFTHHAEAAGLSSDEADAILDEAERNGLSPSQVRALVRQWRAAEKIKFIARQLPTVDPVPVLYADPPWQYEADPRGGGNRAIHKIGCPSKLYRHAKDKQTKPL
jgi:hypothetical protein